MTIDPNDKHEIVYPKEWEESADRQELTGEDRKEWLRHRQLLHEAGGDDDKWYKEANWFLKRQIEWEKGNNDGNNLQRDAEAV